MTRLPAVISIAACDTCWIARTRVLSSGVSARETEEGADRRCGITKPRFPRARNPPVSWPILRWFCTRNSGNATAACGGVGASGLLEIDAYRGELILVIGSERLERYCTRELDRVSLRLRDID
ncbi:hypothetical protein KM043_002415 [Ampulex compressa]|nr:hypothetical protein KM043_002415 [Ampulex compressa]